jgi:DNA-3-methyladenine glycosylase II
LTHTEKLSISAVAPFNFNLSTKIFANGDPQIRKSENGKFHQLIRIDDAVALCSVESTGTVTAPTLEIGLKTNAKLTTEQTRKAAETVKALFNLDFDLKPFYKEVKHDVIMASITKKLYGLKSPTTQFAFESLVDSIVEQQIALKVANVFERRIIKKWGKALTLNDETYYAYPTPKELSAASQQELRAVGLSERKAEYVRNAASLIVEGKLDLEALKTRENAAEIIEELDAVKGVGVWTAELTMLRGMRKLEAMPADDLGLRRTIAHFYCDKQQINSSQARKIAENWGTWKGLAAYYLIIAEMVEAES